MSLPASYDVFISYPRADSRPDARGLHWVEALHDRLVEDFESYGRPLRVFLDTDEIASMDDWGRRILVGLRQSKVLLCCLSPSYFASNYCRMEFDEYLARQTQVAVGDDTIAVVYFVQVADTVPAVSGRGGSGFWQPSTWISWSGFLTVPPRWSLTKSASASGCWVAISGSASAGRTRPRLSKGISRP